MSPKQSYNSLLAKKLIEEFQKRNMEGFYCETMEDALKKAIEMIPKNSTISYGGSETLNEIGLREVLNNGDYNFLDPNSVVGGVEKEKIAHQALASDYYFMSSNAISESGELVNVDGYGNRVASLIFGPKNVIIIAGLNKVVPNLDMAILRTKNYASQMILLKFKQDYSTFEELSKVSEGVGSQFVITSMSSKKGRIKVILVGENLGF
ncbi:lactate utilization protein [Metaclostridioides mangenotii]|uniref:lactate utilization protein n=1 Tax=Metaclostridioides mangenotii TaxID=1540 RepID=UPI0028E6E7D4|nr:lactate utilization protein [Clostridioides mangenotii]